MSATKRFTLAPGYVDEIWQHVGREGVIMRTVQPCTALGVQPGPYDECWSNALALLDNVNARPVLGGGWFYVEGVAVAVRDRVIAGTPYGVVRRDVAYPHAWVVDRATGLAYEPTDGWVHLVDSSLYVGLPVEADALEQLRRLVASGFPAVSALELVNMQRAGVLPRFDR